MEAKTGKKLSAEERNALLLARMKGVENRTCRFVCNMVLYFGNERFVSVQETLEGELIAESRGSGGFGYDPIVFIPSYGKTVAELSGAEKDFLSHRGKAGRKIAEILAQGI